MNYIGNIVQTEIGLSFKEAKKYLGRKIFVFLFSLSVLNHSKPVCADYSISSLLLVMFFSKRNTHISIAENESSMYFIFLFTSGVCMTLKKDCRVLKNALNY